MVIISRRQFEPRSKRTVACLPVAAARGLDGRYISADKNCGTSCYPADSGHVTGVTGSNSPALCRWYRDEARFGIPHFAVEGRCHPWRFAESVFFSIPEAEERISANLSSLLTCLIPINTFLIATLVLRWERFTLSRFGGGVFALTGVAMFIGLEKIQFSHSQLAGIGIIAGGDIFLLS